jgi:hypothetical protein
MCIIWKVLDGYSRYEISNSGLVKNIKTGKLISGSISQGYVCVTLYPDTGKQKGIRLHRIVARLFCVQKEGDTVVNHKDGNKTNNLASNLEWTTPRENTRHASSIGKIIGNNYKVVKRICPETNQIKVYSSIKEAFEDNKDKIKYSSYIVNTCSGKQATSGGYRWEYEQDLQTDICNDGKEIVNYTNYLITKDGKIYNKKSKKYLKPVINNAGYLIIDLQGDSYDNNKDYSLYSRKRLSKRKKFRIHRLVAEYFISKPDSSKYYEVNHKNKIKTDNRVDNLEWVSSLENLRHAHNKTVYQYTLDCKLVSQYQSLREASQKTGINYKNISSAVRKGYPHTAGKFYWLFSNFI